MLFAFITLLILPVKNCCNYKKIASKYGYFLKGFSAFGIICFKNINEIKTFYTLKNQV